MFLLTAQAAPAQTFPAPEYWRGMVRRPRPPVHPPEPQDLQNYVVEGKLRLSLADAIRLTLANNTEIQINQLDFADSRFAIDRAYQLFDPVFAATFNTRRSTTPTTTQLAGAATLTDLNQTTSAGFTQQFFTGTRYTIDFSGNKSTTNSIFSNFNPSIGAGLDFSVTQPLLRNRGIVPNKAPLIIARRNFEGSRN
ncbi:MAG: hypothetical protein ACRD5W_17760, partial [Candidatus Acidiferrales bacterium]